MMVRRAATFGAAFVVAGWVLAGCAGAPTQSPSATLAGPVDVESRRAVNGRTLGRFDCPAPPPPVLDPGEGALRTDAPLSFVDPTDEAAAQPGMVLLNGYAQALAGMSDAFVRSRPADPRPALCVMHWLAGWARADAMLGRMGGQASLEREWTLTAVAAAWLKVRDDPAVRDAEREAITAWLGRLGHAVQASGVGEAGTGTRFYWSVAAVMLAAVAADDHALFARGLEGYRAALRSIRPDGVLPLALARGAKALQAHAFALTPLVLVAEVGARNVLDLYGEADGALARLADRVIRGIDDPTTMAALAGVEQDRPAGFGGLQLLWAEPWYARNRDARLPPLLIRNRPIANRWLGGDATLDYGIPDLPR